MRSVVQRARLLALPAAAFVLVALAGVAGAKDGDDLVLGQYNEASTTTSLYGAGLDLRGNLYVDADPDRNGDVVKIVSDAWEDAWALHIFNPGGGLQVEGSVQFGTSGLAIVPAGKNSVRITIRDTGEGGRWSADITTKTQVLALLQQNSPGVWVRGVVVKPWSVTTVPTITIYLNKTVSADTKVAWFAEERA